MLMESSVRQHAHLKAIASLPSLQDWRLFCILDTLCEDLGRSHVHRPSLIAMMPPQGAPLQQDL